MARFPNRSGRTPRFRGWKRPRPGGNLSPDGIPRTPAFGIHPSAILENGFPIPPTGMAGEWSGHPPARHRAEFRRERADAAGRRRFNRDSRHAVSPKDHLPPGRAVFFAGFRIKPMFSERSRLKNPRYARRAPTRSRRLRRPRRRPAPPASITVRPAVASAVTERAAADIPVADGNARIARDGRDAGLRRFFPFFNISRPTGPRRAAARGRERRG